MSKPWIRNLPVPYYSQRENRYKWQKLYEKDDIDRKTKKILHKKGDIKYGPISMAGISCNITCLAMILKYLGITSDKPDHMMKYIFEEPAYRNIYNEMVRFSVLQEEENANIRYNILYSPNNLEKIATKIYNAKSGTVEVKSYLIDDIKEEIANGFPVIISCGIVRTIKKPAWSNESETTWPFHGHYIIIRGFKKNGDVIINDPWGKATDNNGNLPNTGKGLYANPDGDNIVIKKDQFEWQYKEHFWSATVIYHHRWSFVFPGYIKEGEVVDDASLESCYKLETFKYGGFPINTYNLWHNGIHIKGRGPDLIKSIGSGKLIAARIVNGKKNPPSNGSRCFVFIKHQIKIKDKIKEFYVLYMNLEQLTDFKYIKKEFPVKKSEVDWLNQLLFKINNYARVFWDRNDKRRAIIYSLNNGEQIGVLNKNEVVRYYDKDEEKIYYYYNYNNSTVKCWSYLKNKEFNLFSFTTYNLPKSHKDIYKKKVNDLLDGEIVYFHDLPDDYIEIERGANIGRIGGFGGPNILDIIKLKNRMFHLEVFSDEIIIPDNELIHYKVIKKDETSIPICNRREMIKLFEKKGIFNTNIHIFNYIEDGVITSSEMEQFYNSRESNILRKYIIFYNFISFAQCR